VEVGRFAELRLDITLSYYRDVFSTSERASQSLLAVSLSVQKISSILNFLIGIKIPARIIIYITSRGSKNNGDRLCGKRSPFMS
jgi:hypothetical protein